MQHIWVLCTNCVEVVCHPIQPGQNVWASDVMMSGYHMVSLQQCPMACHGMILENASGPCLLEFSKHLPVMPQGILIFSPPKSERIFASNWQWFPATRFFFHLQQKGHTRKIGWLLNPCNHSF